MPLVALAPSALAGPLDFAHGLFREKRYALAADEYQRALQGKLDGENAREGQFYLAESFVQMGKPDEALPLYDKLLQDPALIDLHRKTTLFRSAQILSRQGKWSDCETRTVLFVKTYPSDPLTVYVWNLLGESRLSQENLEGAAQAFDQASKLLAANTAVPPDANLRATVDFGRAKVAERQGNADEARQLFQKLVDTKSNDFADDAQMSLGILAFQQKRYGDATTDFEKLRATFPQSPLLGAASLNLGLSLEQLGRYDEASKVLHDTLAKYPEHERAADMAYHAARAEYQAGRFRLAKDELVRWATQYPDDPRADLAWYSAAQAAIASNETPAAIGIYEKLVAKYPSSSWRDRAAAALAEALAADPNSENRGLLLDRLVAETKEPAAASRVRYYAAVSKFDAKQYADASQLLRPLVQSNPEQIAGQAPPLDPVLRRDANYLFGVCLAQNGQWKEAIVPLATYLGMESKAKEEELATETKLAESKTTNAAIQYLGDALSRTDETPANHQLLERLTTRAKESKESAALLRLLAEQHGTQERFASADKLYALLDGMELPPVDRASMLVEWGWTLVRLEQDQAALAKFETAAMIDTAKVLTKAEAWYMTGVTTQRLGKNDQAIGAFQTLRDQYATSEYCNDASFRLADLLASSGKKNEADAIYASLATSLMDSSELDRVLYERAWLALDRDRADESEKLFTDLTQRFPKSPLAGDARLKLAELLYAKGDFQASFDQTVALEQAQPDGSLLPALFYRRGLAAYRLEKVQPAKEAFEKVAADFPTDPLTAASLFWLGELAFDAGAYATAITQYQGVLQRPEGEKYHSTSQLRVAESHLAQKEWQKAFEQADSLAKSEPQTPVAREALYVQGRALAQQARFDEAREKYAAVIGADRSELSAKACFMTAETFLHQRKYDEALRQYLQVKILYRLPEWQAMALLQAGRCQEELKQPTEAKESYRQVIDEFPNSPSVPAAKERFEALQTERKGS